MEILAGGIGLLVGIGLWFPYKHVLNRLVAKKRETSAILGELAMSEIEHQQNQQLMKQQQLAQDNANWDTSYTKWATGSTGPYPQYASAQVGPGNSSPSFSSSTNLGVQYCTQCKILVEKGFGSCPHGIGAP